MYYAKRILVVFSCVWMCVACGQKSKSIFLEKDGTLYEIADQVSFYYPKKYEVDSSKDNKEVLQFIKDDEILNYATIKDDTDNKVEDMPELYVGQLEQEGALNVHYYNLTLDSGLKCYTFTGTYGATGLKFKHVVYFTENASYIYSYQASKDDYDDHIEEITQYLESLTVHHDATS